MNPVAAYNEYIKPSDIRDATQYSTPVVYQIIREMEAYQEHNDLEIKLVHRRPSGRGIRIHRDGFFKFFATRENMQHIPEYLKNA